jgi:hypothetical protein
MAWRLQKSSIFAIVAGPPIGEPPIDLSPEIKGNTVAFIWEAAQQCATYHQDEVY